MKVLFCCDDYDSRRVDQHFEQEYLAALKVGLEIGLINFHAIRRREEDEAFRRLVTSFDGEQAIYRGWMLTPEEYGFVYSSLSQRNLKLITAPEQYIHCHWLPNSYPQICEVTPRTISIPIPECFDITKVLTEIQQFGGRPLIVKDFVKSRKHEWKEACYIPDSSDYAAVAQVTKRFLELQDDDLQGGLVFREFVELQPVGTHLKSGMPLTLEYRLFVFDQRVISVSPYWDADYGPASPPIEFFLPLLSQVQSPFFSCDVARRTIGEWIIVELGDGQVAGLPEQCDVPAFYQSLVEKHKNSSMSSAEKRSS